MAVTKEDLQAFHRFADEKLDHDEARSLVELAGEWEAYRREMEEAVADIRQSHTDIDAGRVASVSDTFAEVRGDTVFDVAVRHLAQDDLSSEEL